MKKIIPILVCLISGTVFAQQYSLNTLYSFNEVLVNPAAVGAKDYIPVNFNFRKQWAGFDGAPTSQTLTAHAPLANNLGFGGMLYNDVSGPSRSTGINLMLAYRLRLTKNDFHALRFGLGVSFSQHTIDREKLTTEVANDPAIMQTYNNQFVPDADFGMYYTYKQKGFAGISVKNCVQSNRDLYSFNYTMSNTMVRHYYFIGGYNFELDKQNRWELKTTTLMRMIESKPFQLDVNAIAYYKSNYWFGLGYRMKEAVSVFAGFQYNVFKMGYAYDFGTSDIRNYSSGSHEVFLELQLPTKKAKSSANGQTPYLKRNRVYTTEQQ